MTIADRPRADEPSSMEQRPGHLIRRVHQIHDALWSSRVSQDATPTQFAVLSVIHQLGSCDQTTAARVASLDTSTAGSVILRLIDRGWLRAESSPVDRRRNLLRLTPEGERSHARLQEAASSLTDDLVAPLAPQDRLHLVELLQRVIDGHERS